MILFSIKVVCKHTNSSLVKKKKYHESSKYYSERQCRDCHEINLYRRRTLFTGWKVMK
jgi:hypothetical protein